MNKKDKNSKKLAVDLFFQAAKIITSMAIFGYLYIISEKNSFGRQSIYLASLNMLLIFRDSGVFEFTFLHDKYNKKTLMQIILIPILISLSYYLFNLEVQNEILIPLLIIIFSGGAALIFKGLIFNYRNGGRIFNSIELLSSIIGLILIILIFEKKGTGNYLIWFNSIYALGLTITAGIFVNKNFFYSYDPLQKSELYLFSLITNFSNNFARAVELGFISKASLNFVADFSIVQKAFSTANILLSNTLGRRIIIEVKKHHLSDANYFYLNILSFIGCISLIFFVITAFFFNQLEKNVIYYSYLLFSALFATVILFLSGQKVLIFNKKNYKQLYILALLEIVFIFLFKFISFKSYLLPILLSLNVVSSIYIYKFFSKMHKNI